MQELDDIALLRKYTEQNSGEAFAELVARHVNKVYSVALRQTRNPHHAEEITQAVFVTLAEKARHLGKGVILSGWLYETARLKAVTFIRSEIRRARRDQEAHMQTVLNENEPDPWPQVAPVLDEAMAELNEIDRHAVVLRFFDGCSMSQVGAALGASEDTAKKRVTRAVEKLRLFFTKRGVALPAAALTAAISANSVQAAPLGLAKSISMIAITQGAAAGGPALMIGKALMKPLFTASAGTFAALAPFIGSGYYQSKSEIEHGRSPRERQLIVRMIWLRLSVALLFTAVPIAIAVTMPDFVKQPGVIEFGFAGYCFLGAVESAARMLYFQRRRRQIQIEDGTLEESDRDEQTEPAGFLADLAGTSTKTNRYAAIAAVFGLVGGLLCTVLLTMRLIATGHWAAALGILFWVGFGTFRWPRNWRQRSRIVFDARFGKLVKVVCFFGVLTLVILDLSWARGRLPQSNLGAIGSNVAVVLAYAGLIAGLARWHRQPLAP